MKLTHAIKEKGKPFMVSNCSRNELPQFLKEMGYQTGVEIGVYRGEFTQKFLQEGLKMYAIDPWKSFIGQGRVANSQSKQNDNYNYALSVLSKYPNCTIVRKASIDALRDFKPDSLDFVYVDGDHGFPYVAEDIYHWYWKVRRGGIVSGDDYFCNHPIRGHEYYYNEPKERSLICQVSPVVKAFIETYRIGNFYVFDGSWMFFKP